MINITPHRKRFLKLWLKYTAIIVGIIIGAIVGISAVVYGFVYLGIHYGSGAVISVIALTFLPAIAACFAGPIAEHKLSQIEKEEEETMDALKSDFSGSADELNASILAHLNNKSKFRINTTPKVKKWT